MVALTDLSARLRLWPEPLMSTLAVQNRPSNKGQARSAGARFRRRFELSADSICAAASPSVRILRHFVVIVSPLLSTLATYCPKVLIQALKRWGFCVGAILVHHVIPE